MPRKKLTLDTQISANLAYGDWQDDDVRFELYCEDRCRYFEKEKGEKSNDSWFCIHYCHATDTCDCEDAIRMAMKKVIKSLKAKLKMMKE